jgi:hypothetical protein
MALLLLFSAMPCAGAGPGGGGNIGQSGRPQPMHPPARQQSSGNEQRSKQTVQNTATTRQVTHSETLARINELATFGENAANRIRNEVRVARKQGGVPDAELKAALGTATRLDSYAQRLRLQERQLAADGSNSGQAHREMMEMSQQLQLQLQQAMSRQQQSQQVLSNIMKSNHDTLQNIIQNMR